MSIRRTLFLLLNYEFMVFFEYVYLLRKRIVDISIVSIFAIMCIAVVYRENIGIRVSVIEIHIYVFLIQYTCSIYLVNLALGRLNNLRSGTIVSRYVVGDGVRALYIVIVGGLAAALSLIVSMILFHSRVSSLVPSHIYPVPVIIIASAVIARAMIFFTDYVSLQRRLHQSTGPLRIWPATVAAVIAGTQIPFAVAFRTPLGVAALCGAVSGVGASLLSIHLTTGEAGALCGVLLFLLCIALSGVNFPVVRLLCFYNMPVARILADHLRLPIMAAASFLSVTSAGAALGFVDLKAVGFGALAAALVLYVRVLHICNCIAMVSETSARLRTQIEIFVTAVVGWTLFPYGLSVVPVIMMTKLHTSRSAQNRGA